MASISASDYRQLLETLIEQILLRPSMYFNSLKTLESILVGHALAFEQVGAIDREQSFHVCFSEWLWQTRKVSTAAGWVHAIGLLASTDENEMLSAFRGLVTDFLAQWD